MADVKNTHHHHCHHHL